MPSQFSINAQGRGARDLQPHPNDVICVTKRFCSDTAASQRPVLILPQSFLQRLPSSLPLTLRPQKPVPAERRASWLELASVLLRQRPLEGARLVRAVSYLKAVATGQSRPQNVGLSPLPWHERAKQPDLLEGVADLSSFPRLLPVAAFKARLRQ